MRSHDAPFVHKLLLPAGEYQRPSLRFCPGKQPWTTSVLPLGGTGPGSGSPATVPEMAGTSGAGLREPASGHLDTDETSSGAHAEAAGDGGSDISGSRWRSQLSGLNRRTASVVAGLSCVVAVPMVIAVWVLSHPRWLPLSDMAQIELRVRDVGLDHPPLVGPSGRLEGYGEAGSHPGPLMYYVLAPVYRLFGSDGNALIVSSVFVSMVAVALAIWIGYRRGGWLFALAVAVVLGLLVRNYGAWRIAEPWNPHLPLIWWFVFLLAIWSVLCDDLRMLPLAGFAGTLCAQAHIAYLALVIGLGALTGAYLIANSIRRRRHDSNTWRPALIWGGATIGFIALLWLPPLVDQIQHDPGNLAIIIENFRHPYASRPTVGTALSFWAERLDARQLFTPTTDTSNLDPHGSSTPGFIFLGLWGATAAASLWRRDPALLRLHGTVAVTLAIGLLAISRIVGPMWTYLGLWMWGVCALMMLAVLWSLLTLAKPRASQGPLVAPLLVPTPTWPAPTAAFLAAGAMAIGVLFSLDAARSHVPSEAQSSQLRELIGPTVAGLKGDPAGCGDDCRYVVTWVDPYTLGGQAFGLLAELEGEGLDARSPGDVDVGSVDTGVGNHRFISLTEADAEVHLAVGVDAIEAARARPGSNELAYVDPNTRQEQADYLQARRELVAKLKAEGFTDEAIKAESEPYSDVPVNDDMSRNLRQLCFFLNSFEKPAATFVLVVER